MSAVPTLPPYAQSMGIAIAGEEAGVPVLSLAFA